LGDDCFDVWAFKEKSLGDDLSDSEIQKIYEKQ
jgi:hypothetical protein